jgi:hypothetical protein
LSSDWPKLLESSIEPRGWAVTYDFGQAPTSPSTLPPYICWNFEHRLSGLRNRIMSPSIAIPRRKKQGQRESSGATPSSSSTSSTTYDYGSFASSSAGSPKNGVGAATQAMPETPQKRSGHERRPSLMCKVPPSLSLVLPIARSTQEGHEITRQTANFVIQLPTSQRQSIRLLMLAIPRRRGLYVAALRSELGAWRYREWMLTDTCR